MQVQCFCRRRLLLPPLPFTAARALPMAGRRPCTTSTSSRRRRHRRSRRRIQGCRRGCRVVVGQLKHGPEGNYRRSWGEDDHRSRCPLVASPWRPAAAQEARRRRGTLPAAPAPAGQGRRTWPGHGAIGSRDFMYWIVWSSVEACWLD